MSILKRILFLACFIPVVSLATGVKAKAFLPTPLIAADGSFSVGCRNEERIPLRWPVLKFARTVIDNFQASFINLRDIESPLYIELGTSTDPKDVNVRYRTIRTEWGFSQLVVVVPNPDVVELDLLRAAIIEGLLRERCRKHSGSYTQFKWPKWFIQAMADASLGSVWKANAYEKVYDEFVAQSIPSLNEIFSSTEPKISREVAAFFALWVLDLNPSILQRQTLITANWDATTFLGSAASEEAWNAWIKKFDDHVFLPGAITKRQFDRWLTQLKTPLTKNEALDIVHTLTRMSAGRPALFRDLSALYMHAYLAWINEDYDQFVQKRQEADAAAEILKNHFKHSPMLIDESSTPSFGADNKNKWNMTNEAK